MDNLFEVLDVDFTSGGIGVQRIRIITQAGDGEIILLHEVANSTDLILIEPGNVHVRDTGIATIGLAGRPAHEFDTSKPFLRRKGKHFIERQIREDCTDKTELHGIYSPGVLSSRASAW